MANKTLEIVPITFREACIFIKKHHTHHIPPVGWKFGLAVSNGEQIVGVATIGRPVARRLDDGWTLEVNRCCTDKTKHVASKLYAGAWRAAKALGYKRIITYTLINEVGTSIKASGWKVIHKSKGGSWSCKSRPRIDKHPLQEKICWERSIYD